MDKVREYVRSNRLLKLLSVAIIGPTLCICSCIFIILIAPDAEQEPQVAAVTESVATRAPTVAMDSDPSAVASEMGGELAIVVDVIDGDTINVAIEDEQYRVRYIGIDTPERGEFGYDIATERNAELVAAQTVILVQDVSETDSFGRLLRYVYLTDETMVNAALVEEGYAVAVTYPPDVAFATEFAALQQLAQESNNGLWEEAALSDTFVTELAAATVAPTMVPTDAPTSTATPSATSLPTETPSPIETPIPTETPLPTSTPLPTNTPQPTATPTAVPPTNTPIPTATIVLPTATTEPVAVANIYISQIFYDGLVSRVESDEYVVITNGGTVAVNLAGYRINAGNPGQDFTFPDFTLQPGQSCRVYTNEIHPDWCVGVPMSFGSGQAIWNNGGDCGYLFDNTGAQIDQRCY